VKEITLYNALLIAWLAVAAVVFIALFFIAAPYGRHSRKGWGFSVGNRMGWVLMEAPAPLVFALCFIWGGARVSAVMLIFVVLWETHYLHRAFIYPFSLRGDTHRMPLSVVGFGVLFNLMNGYLNGRYIFTFSGGYSTAWLADPRFIAGVALFVAGFVLNRRSDQILRSLRQPGESSYKIANTGFYRWVSCPNYLGEIVIWIGWAIATWSLAGVAFAFWTIANLMPRARAHHAWYRDTFPDYPEERKALVPRLW